jgi:hypothetical protein
LIVAISAAVGVRVSYAQKRPGAVLTASGEERDARLAFAAVHPAARQSINAHTTLSIAAQTIRAVDCTPHHHLLRYRPAASMPQVLVRGMDLLTRLTWSASGQRATTRRSATDWATAPNHQWEPWLSASSGSSALTRRGG